jgi:hypothetical protein
LSYDFYMEYPNRETRAMRWLKAHYESEAREGEFISEKSEFTNLELAELLEKFHEEMTYHADRYEESELFDSINYTYNVAPMFYEALNVEGSIKINQISVDLAGKTGEELFPVLDGAIKDMEARPYHYTAMNPSNGWGNYDGALDVLKKIRMWCKEAPKAVLRVS